VQKRGEKPEWLRVAEELEASGLAQREFAGRRGPRLSTLQSWVYRRRRQGSAVAEPPIGCKRTVVFKLLREGRLAAAPKLGRKRMVLTASVDALLEAGGVGAVAEPRKLPRPRGPCTESGKILAAEIAQLPVE
jgi:hypothetical protein